MSLDPLISEWFTLLWDSGSWYIGAKVATEILYNIQVVSPADKDPKPKQQQQNVSLLLYY